MLNICYLNLLKISSSSEAAVELSRELKLWQKEIYFYKGIRQSGFILVSVVEPLEPFLELKTLQTDGSPRAAAQP